MRIQNSLLLALAHYCFAAKFSVDATCRADVTLFNGLNGAMKEGIDLAANALAVMTDHADDQWVQKMATFILGTDDYTGKFIRAKGTFAAVKAYERDPSPLLPSDPIWKSTRTNADVELFCGGSRFTPIPGSKSFMDEAMERQVPGYYKTFTDRCYKPDYVLGTGGSAPKAMTLSSDLVDRQGYHEALEINLAAVKADFKTPMPNIACTIDICTWFTQQATIDNWPILDAARVDMCKTDEFKASLKYGLTPVDGLKTIGSTMLHELTHTNQGGILIDVPESQRPEDANSCYNWICIGKLKNEKNADSIAMLGIAMKLWTLRYYAEDDGGLHPIP